MAKRITVVVSQGQSAHPAKRKLEEDLVAQLMLEGGLDVTVVPNVYDLAPEGTGMLCLSGIAGDLIVLAWLYPRASHWILDRNGIRGQFGRTLLESGGDDEEDEEDEAALAEEQAKPRVVDTRELPKRSIYCLDLRTHSDAAPYVEEVRRIAEELRTETVDLLGWIAGTPKPDQLDRYLHPGGNGNGAAGRAVEGGRADGAEDVQGGLPIVPGPAEGSAAGTPRNVDEPAGRRWYPVIDFSRCTNCMECIDFCLFGVYGIDQADTILVEQPDNCRKGCPACSRVCPENAILFPQHKTPAIAGSPEAAGGLKIDLSVLFGGGEGRSAEETAVAERDEQLVLAGRGAVGTSVGLARRQSDKSPQAKDALDDLVDALDDLDI